MELDLKLLEGILRRVAEVEDSGVGAHSATPGMFSDVDGAAAADSGDTSARVTRHVKYLEDQGYISIAKRQFSDHWSGLRVTSKGRRFLQPQLAQFDRDFLSKLVAFMDHYIEGSVQDYSAKAAWRLRLREAVAQEDAEAFANTIALIVTKFGAARPAGAMR
ncbi:MAG TPA: hypothetical protein VN661_09090 [Candidatus Acidoferrales bacterium]|nr:hypothetical protein [Candidatus Acidoferrales bacterium]